MSSKLRKDWDHSFVPKVACGFSPGSTWLEPLGLPGIRPREIAPTKGRYGSARVSTQKTRLNARPFDGRRAFVSEARCDRSLAQSAWDSATQKSRPVGYGLVRSGVRTDSLIGVTKFRVR
jgi:hypothetical protein